MTWHRFLILLKRINILTAASLWVVFWGYGLLVGEVPPSSVLPGLMLGTLLICTALSVCALLVVHSWLYLKAAQTGRAPKLSSAAKISFWVSIGLATFIALTVATSSNSVSGSGLMLDALAATVGVFGGLAAMIVFLSSISKSYFQWYFDA